MGLKLLNPKKNIFQKYISPILTQQIIASQPVGGIARCYIMPFQVPQECKIKALSYYVGSVQAGNVQLALYKEVTAHIGTGATLIAETASTAQAAALALQEINVVTEKIIQPGIYYVSIMFDDVTSTFGRRAASATTPEGEIYNNAAGYGTWDATIPATATSSIIPILTMVVESF
jgi:hypothetical protein